jgi:NAD-dependent DNA ligase
MAQREGSVYLWLFIVALVFFSAAAAYAIILSADKEELTLSLAATAPKIEDLENKNRAAATVAQELRELIAGPTASEDEWSMAYYTELRDGVGSVVSRVLGTQREYTYLVQPFPDLQELFDKLIEARDEAVVVRESALEELAKGTAAGQRTIAQVRKDHGVKLEELQDLQDRYEDLENRAADQRAALVRESGEEADRNSDVVIGLNRKINSLEIEKKFLRLRLDECKRETLKEKSIEDISADGELIDLLHSQGRGWIDIGRKNNLRAGIVFRVFHEGKGGKRFIKGSVEVQKVLEETSEVRIVEEVDSLNPIIVGDQISSPFYDPRARPVFVFAGSELESKQVTRDYIEDKMTSYGALIRDQVDINTDFLVAMKNYEASAEYGVARELGVTIIRERDLLEFIGR